MASEESVKRLGGTVGWGIAGGVLLGPVGLLAGLIARYSPLWNFLVDGFGNHDPGAGRYKGKRPRWDVLHPGRAWAMKCAERPETQEEIARDAETYLRNATYPTSDRFIIQPD